MLAPLDNETIFKKAFTDKEVFECFVKDIFGIDIQVGKIETEKQFDPVIGHINFKIDIYAETLDNRFIIEIQKIDYDYNFDRFLHYFLMVLADQQKTSARYTPSQQVLGVVVLTRPYKITQKTGEAIRESVMMIDFNPRNLKDQKIEIWGHNLVFLNPNPKYNRDGVPKEYEDWLNLIYSSFQKSPANYKINLQNKGVARAVSLIDYEKLDPDTLAEMKKAESRKVTEQLLKDESREEGRKEGREEKENTAIRNAIKKGKLSPSEIAEMLEVSLDRVLTLQKEMIT
ncbi:MAG: PD-(D/E)XK nuclease family transposase [Leptospiraceae bacterium]|nr:PD-(D/E)XK nuclease family transposase [Leptospiraceae bacterium]